MSEFQLPIEERLYTSKPHLTHVDGAVYDVRRLEMAAQLLPEQSFDLSDSSRLTPIVEGKYWEGTDGASLGPSDFIRAFHENKQDWERVLKAHPTWSEHIAKVQRVSCALPVLVYRGNIIDGMHRLTKALCEGVGATPFKELPELPAEAIY